MKRVKCAEVKMMGKRKWRVEEKLVCTEERESKSGLKNERKVVKRK